MGPTTLTILCDNVVGLPGFTGEHGFSVLLERGEGKYLFDTGPGLSLPLNLKRAGKDLDGLRRIFVSHGHYDHTGGLKWALETVGKVPVVAHAAMFTRHLARRPALPDGSPRDIGCPHSRESLEACGAEFAFVDRTTEITPGVTFVCGIERRPDQVPWDDNLVLDGGETLVGDPIEEDASLLLETAGGRVLVLGCAHAGVLNILDHLRKRMGITRLHAILGGTHLMFVGMEKMPRVIEAFEAFEVQQVAVSHCTGMAAALALHNHFGERFAFASAGAVFRY